VGLSQGVDRARARGKALGTVGAGHCGLPGPELVRTSHYQHPNSPIAAGTADQARLSTSRLQGLQTIRRGRTAAVCLRPGAARSSLLLNLHPVNNGQPMIVAAADPLDLADHEVDVLIVGGSALQRSILLEQRAHPQQCTFIYREKVAVDVHPEQRLLKTG
jgi:hypothetical protein